MNKLRLAVSKLVMFTLMLVMLLLVYTTVAQVFARFILNNPNSYTEELSVFLLIWATLIGATYGFLEDKHMSLLLIRNKLANNSSGKMMDVAVTITILFFTIAVMLYGGIRLSLENIGQVSNILRIPMSIIYSIVPICGFFIAISCVAKIWTLQKEG